VVTWGGFRDFKRAAAFNLILEAHR